MSYLLTAACWVSLNSDRRAPPSRKSLMHMHPYPGGWFPVDDRPPVREHAANKCSNLQAHIVIVGSRACTTFPAARKLRLVIPPTCNSCVALCFKREHKAANNFLLFPRVLCLGVGDSALPKERRLGIDCFGLHAEQHVVRYHMSFSSTVSIVSRPDILASLHS
jgi:hypothetical protein